MTWCKNVDDLMVGDAGFLIEVTPAGKKTETHIRWSPSKIVGQTTAKIRGQLGTFNNVHYCAVGVATIVRVSQDGRTCQVRRDPDTCRAVGGGPFFGAVANPENRAAHGGHRITERRLRDGATRSVNVNGSHREVGPWIEDGPWFDAE